jgi:lysophospholipase L1-like esterase
MNLTRIALVGFVAACAFVAWPRPPVIIDSHGPTRQLIISSTLARFDDPIVVLGDSIVEASTLPRSWCGHAVVNAGIGGTSTASGLEEILKASLGGKRAALVVVSLGSNDAAVPLSVERYRSNYLALLTTVATLTPRVAIMAIPSPEPGLLEANKVTGVVVDSYNAVLPRLAEEAGAAFIALSAMPEHHTLDGIHLNGAGYAIWDEAILAGIEAVLCKSP